MKIHMVKKGDTLYHIAQKYNVPLEDLIQANPDIANPDKIDVGMKVKIPAVPKPSYELMHQHTVQQGDSLWKLSKAWGIPLSDMIQANPQLKNPNALLTGEVVNIPKLPPAGAAHPVHPAAEPVYGGGMPVEEFGHAHAVGMHEWLPAGKADTAVMPAAGINVEPAPPPAPMPEFPPMPAAVMPPPMMPMPEVNPPYPVTYHHEHHLFAQYPVPAIEAGAQAALPAYPENAVMPAQVPPPYPAAHKADTSPYDHDYPQAYGVPYYGHDLSGAYEHPYGAYHDPHYADGYGYAGFAGAVGSVYDPKDISGYGAQQDGYGDISHAGQVYAPSGTDGGMPSGTGTSPWPGLSGYLPAYVPGLVPPSGVGTKQPAGCVTCGGVPSWQQPMGAAPSWQQQPMPAAPAMTSWPAMPMAQAAGQWPGVTVTATAAPGAAGAYPSPYMGVYPGTGMFPPAVGPAIEAYPGTTAPAVTATASTGYAPPVAGYLYPPVPYGYEGYPAVSAYAAVPSGLYPSPYPMEAYPVAHEAGIPVAPEAYVPHPYDPVPYGYETYAHAYAGYPAAGYPAYPGVPAPVSAAEAVPGMVYPDPYYGPYTMPYPVESSGIPPISPLPPLRDEERLDNDGDSLALHAAEKQPVYQSAAPANKRNAAAPKRKSSSKRRPTFRHKESLPWIKW